MIKRAALFVFVIACTRSASTVSDAPTVASVSASAAPSASVAVGSTLPAVTGHVPLGPSGNIEENKVYAVDGTPLRFMLKNAMRATMIAGGHVWSGQLTVCDGPTTCTELTLSGPDQPPGEWRGYKFVLAFVVPTSLEITRK